MRCYMMKKKIEMWKIGHIGIAGVGNLVVSMRCCTEPIKGDEVKIGNVYRLAAAPASQE